ncbi:MAG: monovalent cation:proton antiporter family protein [Actinomycetota bacterium]
MGNDLVALGVSFLAAGMLARVGRRIGLPTIPFFILAGILTGPHTPGPVLVDDPANLELFASIGLILLLFHLGLEFSLQDLMGGGRSLAVAGSAYIGLNVGGGFVLGLALGWGTREALVIAGATGISSSAITTKLLVELKRLSNPETGLILGIIVVEDVFLALYLALLQPVFGGAEGPAEAILLFARAFGFLLGLFLLARFAARLVGRLVGAEDDELLTVLFVGLAVLVAGISEELGVSEAIGAFMVGLILAETSSRHRIERLVLPLKDAFAAVFFFAFGLTIDPGDIRSVAGPVVVAVALSILLNMVAGIVAARLFRFGRREAASIGLTVLGRGELSLVLATLAAAAGLDSRIGPFVALYILVLAILGPLFASRSVTLAAWLPARLFRRRPVDDELPLPVLSHHLPSPAAPQDRRLTALAARSEKLMGKARRRLSARRQGGEGRLVLPLLALVVVIVYGVAGYVAAGHPADEALALTWSDLTPSEAAGVVREPGTGVHSAVVTAVGLLVLASTFVVATAVVIEGSFGQTARRRRMEEEIERLSDHYVLCAYGRVGRAAARELESEGVPFVVIDSLEELEHLMRRDAVLYMIEDPTSEAALRKAGIERARGLISAVDSDATNVYITMIARSLNPDIYIVARASEKESPDRLRRAGANRVISPYRASGRQMALLVMRPRVVDSLEVLGRRLEELQIEPESPLVGQTVLEACGAAVPLLVHRSTGQTLANPGPEVVVEAGDRILAWGAAADLRPVDSPR